MPPESTQQNSLMFKIEIKKLESHMVSLAENIELLSAHCAAFKELSEDVKESLQTTMENSSQKWIQALSHQIEEKLSETLGKSTKELERAVTQATSELHQSHKARTWREYFMMASFCAGSLAAGMGSGYFFPRTIEREFFLSPEIMKAYQLGCQLQDNWKRLNKADQEKLGKLLK